MGSTEVKCCPACGQILAPKLNITGPVTSRIYDYVAKHPEGVTRDQICDSVYGDLRDGGPDMAYTSISVLICRMNRRELKRHNLRIKSTRGHGAKYFLEAI